MAAMPKLDVPRQSFRNLRPIVLAVSAAVAAAPVHAKLYVFGDSLSDNGNINKVTLGAEPGRDYYDGRFSNGLVWTELLGYRLGKAPGLLYYDPILTSRVDGYNFAHAGAAAVERLYLPDFLEAPGQASYFAKQVRNGRMSARSGDIATLWIGGNDYLNYNEGTANTVVAGVMKSLRSLDATGVGRIVLMNLPALGEIPGEITGPDRYKLNVVSNLHNMLLNAAVKTYRPSARAQIVQVDIAALFVAVRSGAGGFNVFRPGDRGSRTGTCKGDGLLLAACPANYFFYDGVHPTAAGHRFIAGVVRDRLAAPIAAAARVSLGQAAVLPGVTAQLGQIRSRLNQPAHDDGGAAYAFGSGDATQSENWTQGIGADWRSGDWTFGMNVVQSESGAGLAETDAMSAAGDARGYGVYAAWRDDGLSASVAMTSQSGDIDYSRQTEIDGLSSARGTGGVTASSVHLGVAREFVSDGFSIRPEAALTWTRTDFAAFAESGTMGLSDNEYDARSMTGSLGEIGATLDYAAPDWGVSMRAYGVVNLDGQATVWTAAPAAMTGRAAVALERDPAEFGAGVWTQMWLANADGWSLTAEGGAFTDMQRMEAAARLSVKYEF